MKITYSLAAVLIALPREPASKAVNWFSTKGHVFLLTKLLLFFEGYGLIALGRLFV